MDKEIKPVLTHTDDEWVYLTRFATYEPPAWNVELNAGCYYSLMWGTKIATQFRVPALDDKKHWAGNRLCNIPNADRPAIVANAVRYLDFLMDPKLSPWRSVNHAFEVIRDDNGHPTGLYCPDAKEINRAMTHNFCIAVRMAWEITPNVKRWAQFVDLGVDPVAALYYCMFTAPLTDGYVAFTSHCSHTWATFMNGANTVPSLTALDNPPVGLLHKDMFSKKTRGLPSSNHIWNFKGNPRDIALGKEFPGSKIENKRMPYTQMFNSSIEQEAFLSYMKKAAAKRRRMENKYNKENS